MKVHELKCWPPHWETINSGHKTLEIRKNDRGYEVGDILVLKEWVPDGVLATVPRGFTGRECERRVTHVLTGGRFGLDVGYVALSLSNSQMPTVSQGAVEDAVL